MRAKVGIVALLLGVGLLGIVTWFNRKFQSPSTPPAAVTNGAPPKSATQINDLKQPEQPSLASNPKPAKNKADEDEVNAQKIRKRIAELNDLAMSNDTNSLNTILSELNNSDKEIRKGALEAVIQFADRAAIPRLQEIADRTEDNTEKTALLEAIDYLKLPSLTEYLRKKGKSR